MANTSHHDPHRPLIDPDQFEEAGRAFRQWLDRLLGHAAQVEETDIAWEDGEPKKEHHEEMPTGH